MLTGHDQWMKTKTHDVILQAPELAERLTATRNPQPATRLFDGACAGRIEFSVRGQGGFGYDPLFVPDGFTQSFAELGEDAKNKLSHRAQALAKLKEFFNHQATKPPSS